MALQPMACAYLNTEERHKVEVHRLARFRAQGFCRNERESPQTKRQDATDKQPPLQGMQIKYVKRGAALVKHRGKPNEECGRVRENHTRHVHPMYEKLLKLGCC